MITGAEQWHYVVLAYAGAGIILGALCAWVVVDGRRYERIIDDLQRRGIRRRSGSG